MIRTQVYLPEDLYRKLMLYVKTEGVKFSHLIREGVSDVVKKRKKRAAKKKSGWESFIGAYKGKVKTNAVRDIHEYYRTGVIK